MLLSALLLLGTALAPVGVNARSNQFTARAIKDRTFTTSVFRPAAGKRSSEIVTTDAVMSLSKRYVYFNPFLHTFPCHPTKQLRTSPVSRNVSSA
jgi:hypothetical protein